MHGPDCTDPTHDHSHKAHDHSHGHTHDAIGIDSFVYAARRPFAPARLQDLLRALPADVTAAIQDGKTDHSALNPTARALATIVRSKGFPLARVEPRRGLLLEPRGQPLRRGADGPVVGDAARGPLPRGHAGLDSFGL